VYRPILFIVIELHAHSSICNTLRSITSAMEKTGNAIVEVRRIDAAKEIAGKLAQSRNIVYLPSTGGQNSAGGGAGANLLLGIDTK